MSSVIQTILKKKGLKFFTLFLFVGFLYAPIVNAGVGDWIWEEMKAAVAGLLYGAILMPLAWLLAWAGKLVNYALQPWPLITSEFVQTGWVAMRDLGNMLFILVLLGIALDYILFNSVGVKRALPRLLLIALLVNFSLPIAGVFLDFANVFTTFFIERAGGTQFTETLGARLGLSYVFNASSIEYAGKAISSTGGIVAGTTGGVTDGVLTDTIFAIIFLSGTLFIFLLLAILFFIRQLYLSVLLIVLPLVLIASAFPFLSSHFKKWSNKFFQWTMFAPAAAFFLYLAIVFLDSTQMKALNDAIGGTGGGGAFLETTGTKITTYVFAWILMAMSLTVGQSMGIAGAGMAVSTFQKGTKWARGKAYGAAKTGAAAAGRKVKADESLEKFAGKLQNTFGGVGGGFMASKVRGVASKAKGAMEKREAPTAAEKAKWEGLSDAALADEQKVYEKSVVPGSGAKVAQIAAIRARKGKLNVRGADGEIDTIETGKETRKAYAAAKQSKNKEALDLIAKSNPLVFGKIKEEEFEEGLKKGDVIASLDPLTKERILRNRKTGEFLHDVKNKAVESMTTKDFENMKGAWNQKDVEEFISGGAISSSHIRMADAANDSAFINHIQETMNALDELTGTDLEGVVNKFMVLTKKNQAFVNSLKSGKLDQFGVRISPEVIVAIDLAQERIRKGLPLI